MPARIAFLHASPVHVTTFSEARERVRPGTVATHVVNEGLLRQARVGALLCVMLLGACASTTITVTPVPQTPVCDRDAAALVLWAPEWRPDQKDAVAREAAADAGLGTFFAASGCFARAEVRRVRTSSAAPELHEIGADGGRFDVVVTIAVRELGPVVRVLSSAALVEGGTEVVLGVTARALGTSAQPRAFTVHWRHGGPGVVKGVASLPDDVRAALHAGLQPTRAGP